MSVAQDPTVTSTGNVSRADLYIVQIQKKDQGRGVAPRTTLYSFVHHKRVNRKRCPTSLPAIAFGDGRFLPCDICFEERQKLATLKHLPLYFSNQMTHSSCVTRVLSQEQNQDHNQTSPFRLKLNSRIHHRY